MTETNFKEERLMLVHSFTGFSIWSLGLLPLGLWHHDREHKVEEAAYLMVIGNQRRGKKGLRSLYLLQGIAPSDLPSSHYAPPFQVLPPPNRIKLRTNQAFNTWAFRGCYLNHSRERLGQVRCYSLDHKYPPKA
jgi:hypothetical protein